MHLTRVCCRSTRNVLRKFHRRRYNWMYAVWKGRWAKYLSQLRVGSAADFWSWLTLIGKLTLCGGWWQKYVFAWWYFWGSQCWSKWNKLSHISSPILIYWRQKMLVSHSIHLTNHWFCHQYLQSVTIIKSLTKPRRMTEKIFRNSTS